MNEDELIEAFYAAASIDMSYAESMLKHAKTVEIRRGNDAVSGSHKLRVAGPLRDAAIAKAIELRNEGMLAIDVASIIGVSQSTVNNWLRANKAKALFLREQTPSSPVDLPGLSSELDPELAELNQIADESEKPSELQLPSSSSLQLLLD